MMQGAFLRKRNQASGRSQGPYLILSTNRQENREKWDLTVWVYDLATMEEMTPADRIALVNAIAGREGTAKQLALWYDVSVEWLRSFVEENKEELEEARERIQEAESEQDNASDTLSPTQLDDLWITKKFDRLKRYQNIADLLYKEAQADPTDSTVLRELRSYLVAAANELGQLLHRGSGESGSDSLSVDIQGVDLENLR